MRHAGKEPFPVIYRDSQEEGQKYEPTSKSQLKKIHKLWAREQHKNEEKLQKLQIDDEKRTANLEEARAIKIVEDPSLPAAKRIKIIQSKEHRGQRIKLFGWVHRLRRQGNFHKIFNSI